MTLFAGGEVQGEFQSLLDICGIDHRCTSPYHPQVNGLTERANQTMGMLLRKVARDDADNWDKVIDSSLRMQPSCTCLTHPPAPWLHVIIHMQSTACHDACMVCKLCFAEANLEASFSTGLLAAKHGLDSCCCCSPMKLQVVLSKRQPSSDGSRLVRNVFGHAKGFKLQPLNWELHIVAGFKGGPRTNVLGLEQTIGPCFIQHDPVESGYWYNGSNFMRLKTVVRPVCSL